LGLYPLMILCGIFASGIYACFTAAKYKHDYTDLIYYFLFISIGVIIGSHLLYVAVNYKTAMYFIENAEKINTLQKLFNVLNYLFGGSVYYGGLFGGIITGSIITKKNNKYSGFFDIVVTSIPLFHFFGRIGCFLGGCCYGIKSHIGFIYTRNPIIQANGVKRFPVQILEAAFNIGVFLLLDQLLRHNKFKNKLLYIYLGIYSVGRFLIEYLRGDSYRGIWFSFSTSQIISILIISVLIIRFCCKYINAHKFKHMEEYSLENYLEVQDGSC